MEGDKVLEQPGRLIAIITAIVFVVSLIFPISAGVVDDPKSIPPWWGMLDVVVAAVLCGLAIYLAFKFDRRVTTEIRMTSYSAYRVMINVMLLLLVIFLLIGERVTWTYFLPGIAWRTWLAFYAFPAWLTAFRS